MNLVSKKFSLVLVAASALLFAGCPKAPVRPDPGATAIGQPVGPARSGSDVFRPIDQNVTSGTEQLTQRGPNDMYDDGTMIHNPFGAASQVFFDFDRSEIKQSERGKFPAIKEYLQKNPGSRVLFEGHCDWRGTAEYNLALGERRALAAKKYLQSLGVKANSIDTTSKGSLDAVKGDEAAMAKDRRAEILIIKAQPSGAAAAAAKTL